MIIFFREFQLSFEAEVTDLRQKDFNNLLASCKVFKGYIDFQTVGSGSLSKNLSLEFRSRDKALEFCRILVSKNIRLFGRGLLIDFDRNCDV